MTLSMPKRLLILSMFYIAVAIGALVKGIAIMPALLLLMLVLAIFARHQATSWILRGFAVFMLLCVSLMPYLLEQNQPLAEAWHQWHSSALLHNVPSWVIFTIAIIFSMLQLWLLLTPKVGRWFQRSNNFNIMS